MLYLRLQTNRLVDGRDYLAVRGASVGIEHAQVDDLRSRRDAFECV